MDLTTATPVEIDTELAALYFKRFTARAQAEQQYREIQSWIGRRLGRRTPALPDEAAEYLAELDEAGAQTYEDETIQRMWERYENLQTEADEALMAQEPYDEEFVRRGGWTRAFLVVNTNGHVHRSMDCSTTYDQTQFHWLPQYSGHDESEIVADAGERACTVCYPSAPVDLLKRATKIFSEDEKAKQQAREEREAKRAAKEAAQVVVEGYVEHSMRGDRVVTKTFKSVRAVTNDIANHLSSLCWYGEEHPSAKAWVASIDACRTALRAKGEEFDYDAAVERARKKVKREVSRFRDTSAMGGEPQI